MQHAMTFFTKNVVIMISKRVETSKHSFLESSSPLSTSLASNLGRAFLWFEWGDTLLPLSECSAEHKNPITALLGRKCRSQPSTFLSLPFPRFWGRVVPEWLNYRLLEDFSFCWFPTIMAGNMTRLLCAPPKDNRFGSFLQCQRGRVVGLWVVIMRSGVRFLS